MSDTLEKEPICELCGENPIVVTEDYKDRCIPCAESTCERCGGETGGKMIGDETYNACGDCGHIAP